MRTPDSVYYGFEKKGHTIKPVTPDHGTTEHGTPEHWNTGGKRKTGETTEHWRNSWNTTE